MASVTIATAQTELEAEQICAMLRAEGIPNSVQGLTSSRWVPLQLIEVLVPDEYAQRARELVVAGR